MLHSPAAEIYYKEVQIVFTDFYIFGMLLKDIDYLVITFFIPITFLLYETTLR